TGSCGGSGPPGLSVRGQADGTLSARLTGTTVTQSGVIDKSGVIHGLSADECTALTALPVDGRPHTVDLGGNLGPYRLIASTGGDGTVTVTGLPLAGVRATVYQLGVVIAIVAAAGLLLAALAGTA